MDKNRIEGTADKLKGGIKEAAGKVTGNDRLRAEGELDKAKGHIKDTVGKAADAARESVDEASEHLRKH